MLIDNLYIIEHFDNGNGKLTANILVNAGHKIFEGHFPGQPVLPGVCQLQIIKELLEKATRRKLFLSEASQCKFLQMVDPTVTNNMQVVIDYSVADSLIDCNAVLKSEAVIFLKMKAVFTIL